MKLPADESMSDALLRLGMRRAVTAMVMMLGLSLTPPPPLHGQADAPAKPGPDPREIDRTLPAKTRGEIDVRISAGSLRIVGEDRDTARVVGRLGADVERLESFVDGRYLRFVTHPPSDPPEGPRALDSELVLYLPKGSDVSLETMEAKIEITDIRGRVRIQSGAGDLVIRGEPRRIDATSVTGDLTVDVACPDVELKTVTGAVDIAGKIESLIAETVESPLVSRADIEVEGLLSTVTGRIQFEGSPASTARLRFRSSSGAVDLHLDPEITGSFSLSSDRGRLTNALGPGWSSKPGRLSAQWQRGDSPRHFEIETFDGDIRLDILPRPASATRAVSPGDPVHGQKHR